MTSVLHAQNSIIGLESLVYDQMNKEKKGNSSSSDQKSPSKKKKTLSPKKSRKERTRSPGGRFTANTSARDKKKESKKRKTLSSDSESEDGSSDVPPKTPKLGKPPTPAQIYREIWESIESMEKQKGRQGKPPRKVPTASPKDSSKDRNLTTRGSRSLILKGSPSRHAKIVAESRSKSETRGRELTEELRPSIIKKKSKSISPQKSPSSSKKSNSNSSKGSSPLAIQLGLPARPSQMSLAMLREELRKKNLSPSGNRGALVNRLGAWVRNQRILQKSRKKLLQSESEDSSPERPKQSKKRVGSDDTTSTKKVSPSNKKKSRSSLDAESSPKSKKQKTSARSSMESINVPRSSSTSRTGAERSTQTHEKSLGRSHFPRITDRKPRVLLGLSGSVASIKVIPLVQAISQFAEVRVMVTEHAKHFFNDSELKNLCTVFSDADEWSTWNKMNDPVLHIELRKWADVLIIAPLSANTLGKLANGLSDNLVTCVARAWDFQKPFLVAPAMNTMMYKHPFTERQLRALESIGVEVINPISKKLACGDIGAGAMAEVTTIEEDIRAVLGISLPTPPTSTVNSPVNTQDQCETPVIISHPLPISNAETQTTATQTGPERESSDTRSVRISSLIDPPNSNHSSNWFGFAKPSIDSGLSNGAH